MTNTTKESTGTLYNRLIAIGFQLDRSDIFSSLSAAAKYVTQYKLNPMYLLTKDARQDFPIVNADERDAKNAVVIGLAPDQFNYGQLNEAFQLLITQRCPLIAIHAAKYYKPGGGTGADLALGPGCFVHGLAYSSGIKPVVVGKPNAVFFQSVLPDGITANECVMIGDVCNVYGFY